MFGDSANGGCEGHCVPLGFLRLGDCLRFRWARGFVGGRCWCSLLLKWGVGNSRVLVVLVTGMIGPDDVCERSLIRQVVQVLLSFSVVEG